MEDTASTQSLLRGLHIFAASLSNANEGSDNQFMFVRGPDNDPYIIAVIGFKGNHSYIRRTLGLVQS